MGSLPDELRLDYKPQFVPRTVSDFMKEVSVIADVTDKVSKLDDFVKKLEDELTKIEPFKRELTLCTLVVNDVIVFLKEESMRLRCVLSIKNQQPVFEEFIPLKNSSGDLDLDQDESGLISNKKDFGDKKNWMSSVQLWNNDDSKDSELESKVKKNEDHYQNGDVFQTCKSRNEARELMQLTCLPLRKRDVHGEDFTVSGLSFLTPGEKVLKDESVAKGLRINCSRGVSASAASSQLNLQNVSQQQAERKQRRCWSPELHRRFVSALEQLGGCQAATPKQIRELMQVDGLTNDEVKSHLQKYRLHSRKMPTATSAPASQSAVLGSFLLSQDQYGNSTKSNISQSGSPEGPLHLAGQTGGTSTTGGDSMEDDEDPKSDGYSWNGHVHRSLKEDV